jgi:hypothetical protein
MLPINVMSGLLMPMIDFLLPFFIEKNLEEEYTY